VDSPKASYPRRVVYLVLACSKLELHWNFATLQMRQGQRRPRRERRLDEVADAEEDLPADVERCDDEQLEEVQEPKPTQLVIYCHGRETTLAPSGDQARLTPGPVRIVETSSRRGVRVFRPTE